jgi:hypothetical protein
VWRRLEDLATIVLWRRFMAPSVRSLIETVRTRESGEDAAVRQPADA